MYKVIAFFTDLQDNNHAYNVGDEYPRKGLDVTAERIAELAGANNKQKKPLIVLVTAKASTKTATKKTAKASTK